jgi:Tfp pilus assembly protein PilF
MTEMEQLLQPAMGYLQLGMFEEANDEIELLPTEAKTDRVVLGIRALIYQGTGSWQLMREVSGFLAHEWPEDSQHWIWLAYATRRCRSITEAQQILTKAARQHPAEPMIHFNLACYAAQTGDLDAARERLSQAITLDPEAKQLALDDPDLAPLWDDLGKSSASSSDT